MTKYVMQVGVTNDDEIFDKLGTAKRLSSMRSALPHCRNDNEKTSFYECLCYCCNQV